MVSRGAERQGTWVDMGWGPSSMRRAATLAATAAWAASCAADPGDPAKGPVGSGSGGDARATLEADVDDAGGHLEDEAMPPPFDSSVGDDSSIADASVPQADADASVPSGDSAPQDGGSDASDAVTTTMEAGAGCDPGVLAITLPAGATNANTGNFGTVGPVCVQLKGSVAMAWNVSNGSGRTVRVTSASGTSPPQDASAASFTPAAPQAGPDGFVYWNFSAGAYTYASMYIY